MQKTIARSVDSVRCFKTENICHIVQEFPSPFHLHHSIAKQEWRLNSTSLSVFCNIILADCILKQENSLFERKFELTSSWLWFTRIAHIGTSTNLASQPSFISNFHLPAARVTKHMNKHASYLNFL